MARLGLVYENLMIDVRASNKKLPTALCESSQTPAAKTCPKPRHALRQSGHNLRIALVMLKLKLTAHQAAVTFHHAKGNLRAALGYFSAANNRPAVALAKASRDATLSHYPLMDKFRIHGGYPLHGTVQISGAKNSALPVMAAALLTAEPVTLHNIPKVRDLITMSKLLAFIGARVSITEFPASDYVIEATYAARRRRPLRLGAHHARIHFHAGPSDGAPRNGARIAPRWLCHRRPPRGPASQRTRKNGRGNHYFARIHRSQSSQPRTPQRRAHHF